MVTITGFSTRDIRFPTSLDKTGSDAMNLAGDYSAAYCILETDGDFQGCGMSFTIGRGNELVCAAVPYFANRLVGRTLDSLTANMGATWRHLVSDSQVRWVGPEKGVVHLALGAVVNALWDLWALTLGKPVWQVVAEMTPEEVVRCIDFRYIEDALTPDEAVELLKNCRTGREERIREAEAGTAVPAYTTSAGWLGYDDAKMRRLLQEAADEGYTNFKLKVGGDLKDDLRRLAAAREVIGWDKRLMVDANQVWSVPTAIAHMTALAPYKPWFIEEPTSPDDILGHAAVRRALAGHSVGVATGEMGANRMLFKQLLQAGAIDVAQPDACRLGGLNEVLAVLLLCRKFRVPVVPHSGGVGLPEYTVHMSHIDYIVVSGKRSMLEFVASLHEHFVTPVEVRGGWYRAPRTAGFGVRMKEESMLRYEFPGGDKSWWRSEEARPILQAGGM